MSKKNGRKDAFDNIVNDFCSRRGIDRKGIAEGLESSIFSVSVPFFLYIESLEKIGLATSDDPVDGLFATLINRCFDAVSGNLALIAVGHLQEAEVLARTVMESALTFLYIGEKDTGERFLQYFNSYIETEKAQNRKWEAALAGCDDATRGEHVRRITEKNEAMELYENRLKHLSGILGSKYPPDKKWPKTIAQKFLSLGRELDYRTVYAGMCSQAHHDAEDVLNRLLVDSLTGIEGYSERLRREKHSFSLFMVMFGMKYYLDAMNLLAKRYKLVPLMLETDISLNMVHRELSLIGDELDKGNFPSHWRGRLVG